MITVYHYPKCSTCRKARAFLDDKGTPYDAIDLVAHPPTLAQLRGLHLRSQLPIAKLFNTSGESYRAGNFADKLPRMTHDEALSALAADGKLIKRPLIDTGKNVIVGFTDAARDALARDLAP
jgi:arsenate reductase